MSRRPTRRFAPSPLVPTTRRSGSGYESTTTARSAASRSNPQPFYKPSGRGRTDRIFSANPSLLSLPREARDVLLSDFTTLDLKVGPPRHRGGAVDAPEALERATGPGVQGVERPRRHFGLSVYRRAFHSISKAFKAACKEAVYSVLYGMGESHVRGQFTRKLGDVLQPVPVDEVPRGLRQHPRTRRAAPRAAPVIATLLEARDRELEWIEASAGRRPRRGSGQRSTRRTRWTPRACSLPAAQSVLSRQIMAEILRYEEEHWTAPEKRLRRGGVDPRRGGGELHAAEADAPDRDAGPGEASVAGVAGSRDDAGRGVRHVD